MVEVQHIPNTSPYVTDRHITGENAKRAWTVAFEEALERVATLVVNAVKPDAILRWTYDSQTELLIEMEILQAVARKISQQHTHRVIRVHLELVAMMARQTPILGCK